MIQRKGWGKRIVGDRCRWPGRACSQCGYDEHPGRTLYERSDQSGAGCLLPRVTKLRVIEVWDEFRISVTVSC